MTNRLYRSTGVRRVSTWVSDPVYITGPPRGTRPSRYRAPKKAPEPEPEPVFIAGLGSPTSQPWFVGGGSEGIGWGGLGFSPLRPPF